MCSGGTLIVIFDWQLILQIIPYQFQIADEPSIKALAEKLTEKKIDHKLWIEQPENIPTCLVTKPYPKGEVQSLFRGLKLYKG